jgi:hypothetical protein
LLLAACLTDDVLAVDEQSASTGDRLVQAAMDAEMKGDADGRQSALRSAVNLAPENKLAHWQLGHIEVEGKWLTIKEAEQAAAANPRLREYDQMRSLTGDRPEGPLALARWCAKNGLTDEARLNWAIVLSQQPNNEEALQALEVRWYNGRLLTREQLAEAKERDRLAPKTVGAWKKRVNDLLQQLEGDLTARTAALREIRAIDNPESIFHMQGATLGGKDTTDEQVAIRRQVSMAFLDSIEAMQGGAAIESMIRHALFSPIQSVRESAAARIKKRPMQDYVPVLLASLQTPIEFEFSTTRLPGGFVQYNHQLYRRGAESDWSATYSRNLVQMDFAGRNYYSRPSAGINNLDRGPSVSDSDAALITDANARKFQQQTASQALSIEQRVAKFNRSVAESNARIIPLLVSTSGKDFGSDPNAWWDWWESFNGYYGSGTTPVYTSNFSDSVYCYIGQDSYTLDNPPPRPRGRYSCFVRGTPVWTKMGQRPIESLRLGDLVLSQDVDTGELAYRPVLENTVRPQSPIIKVSIGDEQIRATLGHPFWVAGVGWKMTRELEAGNILHGINSPARIETVEAVEQEETYNLIVAEFSTYFVGKSGLLVHDNTSRRPTRSVVPGLIKSPPTGN